MDRLSVVHKNVGAKETGICQVQMCNTAED